MMVLQATALFSSFEGGVGTGRSASVHAAIVNGMLGLFASGPSCHRYPLVYHGCNPYSSDLFLGWACSHTLSTLLMLSASVLQSRLDAEDALLYAALLDQCQGFSHACLLHIGGQAESRSLAVICFIQDSRAALHRASSAQLFFPEHGSECWNHGLQVEELAGVITETEPMRVGVKMQTR